MCLVVLWPKGPNPKIRLTVGPLPMFFVDGVAEVAHHLLGPTLSTKSVAENGIVSGGIKHVWGIHTFFHMLRFD